MSSENSLLNHTSNTNNKILVAEDNVLNQKIIQEILRKEGFDVSVTQNGKEALLALEEQSFKCLILDYQMPELDGFQTLQAIRAHANEDIRLVPVIFLTAELNQETLRQIEALGVSQMLPKPLDRKKLVQAVAFLADLPNVKNALVVRESKPDISYLYAITDGNRQLMVELIEIFMEEAPSSIYKMKGNYAVGDFTALLKTIHKIRSNYKYVGMLKGESLLAELEKDVAGNQKPESFMNRIEEIENLTLEFLQVLSREKQQLQKN